MYHLGWSLIGRYRWGVGSWILHHGSQAALLEAPPGLRVEHVRVALGSLQLKYILASHEHMDHFDPRLWRALGRAFPGAIRIKPSGIPSFTDSVYHLDGEPLYLSKASKHSMHDVITVFRGIAMTGDVELGTLDSVNDEVLETLRRRSMQWWRRFQGRRNYRVHTVVSAHLNDFRTEVDWEALFNVDDASRVQRNA